MSRPPSAHIQSTPAHPSNHHQTEFAHDSSDRRAALLEAVGPTVPQVELTKFFTYFLPHFDGSIVQQNFTEICEAVLASQYANGRWLSFKEDPAQTKKGSVVFGGLTQIARTLESAVRDKLSLEPIVVLDNNPDKVPASKWRMNHTRPDGYFILRPQQSDQPHWMDIVFPAEYKRQGSVNEANDDIEKTVWSMHHIMREDARRRFTFGFTVENRTVRLWFGDRAETLVSDAFDFISKPESLIHFFAAVMYAKPEDLGWDPTMTLVREPDGKHQYNIEIITSTGAKLSVYRTVRLISNVGACQLRGRGTRVWEVRQLDANGEPTGPPRALKDSWPDTDRPREADVLAEVLGDIRQLEDEKVKDEKEPDKAGNEEDDNAEDDEEDDRVDARDLFLTVEVSGDVSIGGVVDQTLSEQDREGLYARDDGKGPQRFDLIQVDDRQRQQRERTHQSLEKEVRGSKPSCFSDVQHEIKSPVKYCPKTHHRVVFQEVCKSLYEETDLFTICVVLANVCIALGLMHECGWVHRDISGGNILFIQLGDSIVVKLADLEYAKKYNRATPSSTVHEVRTGTQEFMAVEVYRHAYMFLPESKAPADADPFILTPQEKRKILRGIPPNRPPVAMPTTGQAQGHAFDYNPLHDLESLFWLLAFFIINKTPRIVPRGRKPLPDDASETPSACAARLVQQAKFANSLFIYNNERGEMMRPGYELWKKINTCLHPALRPLGIPLNDIRTTLIKAYTDAEVDVSKIDHRAAQPVQVQLSDSLARAAAHANNAFYRIEVPHTIARPEHLTAAEPPSKPVKRKPADENIVSDENAERPHEDDGGNDMEPPADDSGRTGRKRAKVAE